MSPLAQVARGAPRSLPKHCELSWTTCRLPSSARALAHTLMTTLQASCAWRFHSRHLTQSRRTSSYEPWRARWNPCDITRWWRHLSSGGQSYCPSFARWPQRNRMPLCDGSLITLFRHVHRARQNSGRKWMHGAACRHGPRAGRGGPRRQPWPGKHIEDGKRKPRTSGRVQGRTGSNWHHLRGEDDEIDSEASNGASG